MVTTTAECDGTKCHVFHRNKIPEGIPVQCRIYHYYYFVTSTFTSRYQWRSSSCLGWRTWRDSTNFVIFPKISRLRWWHLFTRSLPNGFRSWEGGKHSITGHRTFFVCMIGQNIESVDQFIYLGSIVSAIGTPSLMSLGVFLWYRSSCVMVVCLLFWDFFFEELNKGINALQRAPSSS